MTPKKMKKKKKRKRKMSHTISKRKVFSPLIMVIRNLGIVTVVDDTSNIEKFRRK